MSRVTAGRPVRRLHGVQLTGPAYAGWRVVEVDGAPVSVDLRFHHVGTDRVGEPGHRVTIQRWSRPGTEDTAMTLSAAVRRWKRAVGLAIGRAFCFGGAT